MRTIRRIIRHNEAAMRPANPSYDAAAWAPVSVLGALLRPLGNGVAGMWAGYVRSLQRADRLPPPL